MNDQLGILNRIDKSREYGLLVANMEPRLYRLTDGQRNYSPNLSEQEMKTYLHGFAMGLEIMRDRMTDEPVQTV